MKLDSQEQKDLLHSIVTSLAIQGSIEEARAAIRKIDALAAIIKDAELEEVEEE